MNDFNWPTNDSERIRTLQGLRSPRVDEAVHGQETDDWLKESVALVARSLIGHATNQRRVRYFGFETTHEQDSK
jgi:hypothetical protein